MPANSIDLERRGVVAIVTLNNPGARHALDLNMRRALLETFRNLAQEGDLRAVLLTGAGEMELLVEPQLSQTDDHAEGRSAFGEKRKPRFTSH